LPHPRSSLSKESGEQVFARFCKLDAQGGQLTADGWRNIAALFVNPGNRRLGRIVVTDGAGPRGASHEGEKIGVGRDYIKVGQIDIPRLRFSAVEGLPAGVIVREDFGYLLKVPGANGVQKWRIGGPVPEPRVTVETAIRYVTEVRAKTIDAAIKRNADRTLAALKYFH
jgi:hypothetical protein